MRMAQIKNLRDFLAEARRRGRLHEFTESINKETELMPLYRVQTRGLPEEERSVLHFKDVRGSDGRRSGMQVAAGVYGASREFLTWGIGCESVQEGFERWHKGLMEPLEPVMLSSAPVHEEVHTGSELSELGLDEIPAPVEEPGFSCVVRTGTPVITRDPQTGMRNMGAYNGFFRARDRIVSGCAVFHDAMAHHWPKARERKEPLPVAIVVGPAPVLMALAAAPIPYGTSDEIKIAGGIMGTPVEMVPCKTVPLEVPAYAEIVIEGLMSTETTEPLTAFGEYPGYMSTEETYLPTIQVTAITHRRNAIFTPVTVGFYPSDSNTLLGFVHESMLYHHLRYGAGFPIVDIHFPDSSAAREFCLIRLRRQRGVDPWGVLHAAAGHMGGAKFLVVVDEDIDVRDHDAILWALSFRFRPEADMEMVYGRSPALDPSSAPPGVGQGEMVYGYSVSGHQNGRLLLNAVRKWAYPPVGLPAKEHMEKALKLWSRHDDLPKPKLREPWYGYSLGNWREEDAENARLIAEGKYLELGEKMAARQRPVTTGLVRQDIVVGR
jgi:4-hydroxy-3-polyprenylbenzoate decarboxylase